MHILLLFGLQALIWSQTFEAKEIIYRHGTIKQNDLIANYNDYQNVQAFAQMLDKYDRNDLRGIADLWQSVKNSAKNAWNHIKNMADGSKQKISAWIEKIKEKADKILDDFKDKLMNLKDKLKEILEKVSSASKKIRQCLKDEKEGIDNITKEIFNNVTTCIKENIMRTSVLERQMIKELDETAFKKELDEKLNVCFANEEIDEDCLNEVRNNMFAEIDELEEDMLNTETTSRNMAEDILNTIIKCSTDGITTATTVISAEAMKIMQCVADSEAQLEIEN